MDILPVSAVHHFVMPVLPELLRVSGLGVLPEIGRNLRFAYLDGKDRLAMIEPLV